MFPSKMVSDSSVSVSGGFCQPSPPFAHRPQNSSLLSSQHSLRCPLSLSGTVVGPEHRSPGRNLDRDGGWSTTGKFSVPRETLRPRNSLPRREREYPDGASLPKTCSGGFHDRPLFPLSRPRPALRWLWDHPHKGTIFPRLGPRRTSPYPHSQSFTSVVRDHGLPQLPRRVVTSIRSRLWAPTRGPEERWGPVGPTPYRDPSHSLPFFGHLHSVPTHSRKI